MSQSCVSPEVGWVDPSKKRQSFLNINCLNKCTSFPPFLVSIEIPIFNEHWSAGHLASRYLANSGLLLFTGAAQPFRQPCPTMLAYGLAKTAVHAIALNVAEKEEIPKDSSVITILP